MAKFETTGKNGALTTYKITGSQAEISVIESLINEQTHGYSLFVKTGEISGKHNKSTINLIRQIVESVAPQSVEQKSVEPTTAPKQAVTKSSRRITLLAAAIEQELNHGKSWTCDGFTVDKHSLPPEWEGEKICYVYQ